MVISIDCGLNTTRCDGQEDDVLWLVEPVTWLLDGQLDQWKGFRRWNVPWLVHRNAWSIPRMLNDMLRSDMLVVGVAISTISQDKLGVFRDSLK